VIPTTRTTRVAFLDPPSGSKNHLSAIPKATSTSSAAADAAAAATTTFDIH